mmetsp:Transcript_6968/g.17093  ORF Transcript_6968/g.17093 Transcript_6968/m.17093 type:complete len:128 (+) Transcript_6968:421-804(+)|eukprot:CAMPEP_0179895172 /NCGR_PEP_ID=MMETSP0982-20121206/35680_1 /TAXON_ID=483367 /ORGANISM="non described non described, Strain CCMP 2436" /LENGTH=127 /DNA_ID=CAMNT_0021791817 /DNA_START=277 /DNA_END=663 /DNA_ORIENTATION=+
MISDCVARDTHYEREGEGDHRRLRESTWFVAESDCEREGNVGHASCALPSAYHPGQCTCDERGCVKGPISIEKREAGLYVISKPEIEQQTTQCERPITGCAVFSGQCQLGGTNSRTYHTQAEQIQGS